MVGIVTSEKDGTVKLCLDGQKIFTYKWTLSQIDNDGIWNMLKLFSWHQGSLY